MVITRDDMEHLVTGDFMKLTKTTRNTLIHYDNIGLLKPVTTNERGDRFYSPFQYYNMQLIRVFQTAGMSLDFIKNFFRTIESEPLGSLHDRFSEELSEARLKLREEEKTVTTTLNFVKKIAYVSEIFNHFIPNGRPVINDSDMIGGLYVSRLNKKINTDSSAYFNLCNNHIFNTYGKLADGSFPLVTCFDAQDFIKGEYNVFDVGSYTLDERFIHMREKKSRPYSRYIIKRCTGPFATVLKGLDEIKEFMKEQNMRLYADIFVITNFYMVSQEGERVGDRLICVPIMVDGSDKACRIIDRSDWEHVKDEGNDKSMRLLRGQFINLCKITRNALNHYEAEGLIGPEFTLENGYKMYGANEINTLIYIKSLKQAGFSLSEIKNLLVTDIVGVDQFYNRADVLRKQQAVIEKKLAEMTYGRIVHRNLALALKNLKNMQEFDDQVISIPLNGASKYRHIQIGSLEEFNEDIFGGVQKSIMKEKRGQDFLLFPPVITYDMTKRNAPMAPALIATPSYNPPGCTSITGEYYVKLYDEPIVGKLLYTLGDRVIKSITNVGKRLRGEILYVVMNVYQDENVRNMKIICLAPVE